MKKSLPPTFFANNRQKLVQKLKGGVVALAAYSEMQRGNDMAFPFEQEGNFQYLTGIEHPDWWLLGDGTRNKWWLVAPQLSKEKLVFDGGLDPEEAKTISGVDEVIDRTEALSLLRQLKRTHAMAYVCEQPEHSERFGFTLNPALRDLKMLMERHFTKVQNCRGELARLRALKQPEELAIIKEAIKLTSNAFQSVKKKLSEYKHEYEIEADFTHYFRSRGAKGHAYDPIIASGKNACTLHYDENNARLAKRSLVLMDVGAQVEGYAADITRTYALGEISRRQKAIHEAVCRAQREIIQLCQPGVSVQKYIEESNAIMVRELVELGLITDAKDEKFYTYYPHAISHGLGIDVHDSLGKPIELQAGMVLTVEPGIYVPEEAIGVRIEDDIYIGEAGPENLSERLAVGY